MVYIVTLGLILSPLRFRERFMPQILYKHIRLIRRMKGNKLKHTYKFKDDYSV